MGAFVRRDVAGFVRRDTSDSGALRRYAATPPSRKYDKKSRQDSQTERVLGSFWIFSGGFLFEHKACWSDVFMFSEWRGQWGVLSCHRSRIIVCSTSPCHGLQSLRSCCTQSFRSVQFHKQFFPVFYPQTILSLSRRKSIQGRKIVLSASEILTEDIFILDKSSTPFLTHHGLLVLRLFLFLRPQAVQLLYSRGCNSRWLLRLFASVVGCPISLCSWLRGRRCQTWRRSLRGVGGGRVGVSDGLHRIKICLADQLRGKVGVRTVVRTGAAAGWDEKRAVNFSFCGKEAAALMSEEEIVLWQGGGGVAVGGGNRVCGRIMQQFYEGR